MYVRRSAGRFFWGLILAGLGVTWLLNNLGIATYDLGDLLQLYWPVIPIYFGVAGILSATFGDGGAWRGFRWGSLLINALWTGFFLAMLGNINDWWYVDVSLFWRLIVPIMLLFLGITMLTGRRWQTFGKTYVAIMFGARDSRTQWDDFSIITVMGGARIDLTRCGLPERDINIELVSVMGGGEILMPPGVNVECDWTGIMGGVKVFGQDASGFMDHRRVQAGGAGPVVRIRATTVMGGFQVK